MPDLVFPGELDFALRLGVVPTATEVLLDLALGDVPTAFEASPGECVEVS